ncbi:hypothetical protein BLOT_016499 [Blomia tropicalis]|nr:hypothetical protein BLOT_016499 [Blomia tropicalis]
MNGRNHVDNSFVSGISNWKNGQCSRSCKKDAGCYYHKQSTKSNNDNGINNGNVSTSTTTEEVPKQEKNIVSSLQNNVLTTVASSPDLSSRTNTICANQKNHSFETHNQEKKLSTLGQKKQSQEDFFDSQMSYNETHFRNCLDSNEIFRNNLLINFELHLLHKLLIN